MYSKAIMNKYIRERLKQVDMPPKQLADALGMTQSNLSRAMDSPNHNFNLLQFGKIIEILELTPDQAFHILTGKRSKEGVSQLVYSSSRKIVDQLINGKD